MGFIVPITMQKQANKACKTPSIIDIFLHLVITECIFYFNTTKQPLSETFVFVKFKTKMKTSLWLRGEGMTGPMYGVGGRLQVFLD